MDLTTFCGAVVVLHTSLDTCKSRVKEREDHFISEKNIKVCALTLPLVCEVTMPNVALKNVEI